MRLESSDSRQRCIGTCGEKNPHEIWPSAHDRGRRAYAMLHLLPAACRRRSASAAARNHTPKRVQHHQRVAIMVLSIIYEAARGAFGSTDIEQIEQRKRIAAEAARKRALAENVLAEANAPVKKQMASEAAASAKLKEASKPPAKADKSATAAPAAPAEPAGPAPAGNAAQGATIFKAKCATCHTCNEGGPQKQGPNLFGILGRKAGEKAGFTFTKALKEKQIEWTDDHLLSFLAGPKAFAKGTSMAFPGFKKECDRADVVAYLKTLK